MIIDKFTIDGIQFDIPRLGNYGYAVGARPWKGKYDKEHFIIKTVGETFDENVLMFAHTPLVIDEVFDQPKFSNPFEKVGIRVLDMPVKFSQSNDCRVPRELNQFDEVISKILSFERHINPNIDLYYAYLTVDQCHISAGKTQRRPGCHINGLQTGPYRRPVSRSYVVYDKMPPIFYAQSFDTSYLDEEEDNYFLSFDDQANEEFAITFDPYNILLTNAYTVHRSDIAAASCFRTFLRLTFDLYKYDRLGNTKNPQFNYKWDMVKKTKQGKLKHNNGFESNV